MSADPKLKYIEIKEQIIKKTQDFLLSGDWNSLSKILSSSPEFLNQTKDLLLRYIA